MQWVVVSGKRRMSKRGKTVAEQYKMDADAVIRKVHGRMRRKDSNVDGGMRAYWFDTKETDEKRTAYEWDTLEVSSVQPYCMSCYSGWHHRYFPGHEHGLVNGQYILLREKGPRNYHTDLEAVMSRYPTLFRKETKGFTKIH